LTTHYREANNRALDAINQAVTAHQTEVQTSNQTVLEEIERDVFESYWNFVKNSTFYIRSSKGEDLYSPSWLKLKFDADSKYAMTWTNGGHVSNGEWRLIHKRHSVFKIQCTADGNYLHSPKHSRLLKPDWRYAMTYCHEYPGGGENEVLWRIERCGDKVYIQNLDSEGYLNYLSKVYDGERRHAVVDLKNKNGWEIIPVPK
jgi:hypothetical protein